MKKTIRITAAVLLFALVCLPFASASCSIQISELETDGVSGTPEGNPEGGTSGTEDVVQETESSEAKEEKRKRLEEYREIGLPGFLDDAIRADRDLLPDEAIDDSIYDEVTKITISGFSNGYLRASVNDSPFETGLAYIWHARRFECMYETIENEWHRQKLASFFTRKDTNDPSLDEEGVQEMLADFPMTKEGPIYALDPNLKPRERRELYAILSESEGSYGFIESSRVTNGEIRLDTLELLPNLEVVEFIIDRSSIRQHLAYVEVLGENYEEILEAQNEEATKKYDEARQSGNWDEYNLLYAERKERDARVLEIAEGITDDQITEEMRWKYLTDMYGCVIVKGYVNATAVLG